MKSSGLHASSAGLIALAHATGGRFGVPDLFSIKPKPVRDKCVKCGETMPPGKPGRKCKACRAAEATT